MRSTRSPPSSSPSYPGPPREGVLRGGPAPDVTDPDELLLFELEGTPAPPPEKEGHDARRTRRQRELVAAGIHPLTRQRARPELGTCGDCLHRRLVSYRNRSYPKCDAGTIPPGNDRPDTWPRANHSGSTDVRAWWPACPDHGPAAEPPDRH